ncbi:hypothetical protein ABZ917_04565 [Nonomuraea wenchangensis]
MLIRAAASSRRRRAFSPPGGPGPAITLRDPLYVIVISSGKNLAKMRDYCSTKLDRIGQHTLVSPRNWSALARDGFAGPLPGCGEVMKAFF